MKRFRLSGVTLVFIVLGWVWNSQATCIMYNDQSTWETDVLGLGYSLTNIDFENTTTSTDAFTVTAGDVIFTSEIWLEVGDRYGIPYNSGKVLYPTHNQPIKVDLPASVYAFGFDLGDLEGLVPPLYSPPTLSNVLLSTGDVFAGPYVGNHFPTFAFFGFVSDLAITSLSMHPHGIVEAIIDNFSYARAAAPTPEPASLLLLSSGILGFAANAWRKRRR